MPDMTMPAHLRVAAAVKAIHSDLSHLASWDKMGKQWVKGEASKGNVDRIVHGLCEHHRREGRRGEFKDLSDEEITNIVNESMQTDALTKLIESGLRIKIPSN